MMWVGIGIVVIGIAFFILVLLLIAPLNNLAELLLSLRKTTDKLPEDVDQMVGQATEILKTSNQTLQDVNEKLHTLSPLFYIANDIGEASHKLASTLTDASKTFQENTAETKQLIQRENLEGLYGGATLGYLLWKNKQKRKRPFSDV